MASVTLQVYQLANALLPEDVVASAHPLDESQAHQKQAEAVEAYIHIRPTAQNPLSLIIVSVRH